MFFFGTKMKRLRIIRMGQKRLFAETPSAIPLLLYRKIILPSLRLLNRIIIAFQMSKRGTKSQIPRKKLSNSRK